MKGRFLSIRMKLLGWLQRQCAHPPEAVSYDIAEGQLAEAVSWCRVCGAVRFSPGHAMHEPLAGRGGFQHVPRANWWIDEAKRAAVRDACEICDGSRGGVPGNENIVESCGEKITMCDYCSADEMRRPGFWKEGLSESEEGSR